MKAKAITIQVEVAEIAKKLHQLGYNVIPFKIHGEEDRKHPLGLREWRQWQDRRQTLEEFNGLNWNLADGVGVVCCGPEIKLFCIDVDNDKEEASAEERELWLRGLIKIFGLKRQKTPHGFHYYGLLDSDLRSTEIPNLFELKGRGSLTIVCGQGYEEVDLDPERLPRVSAEKLSRAIEILRRLWKLWKSKITSDLLRELRTEGQRSEADMKLFHLLLREGWSDDDIYTAWCLLSDRYFTEVLERKHRDPKEYFTLTLEKVKKSAPKPRDYDVLLEVKSLASIVETAEDPRWFINGIIPRRGLMILGGKAGSWKSTFTLFLAHKISCGGEVFDGLRVEERTRILWLDGENGEQFFKHRANLLGLNSLDGIGVITPARLRLDSEDHVEKLRELISRGSYGLVIVDPLSAFLGDVDENDAVEMANIMYRVRQIAYETNCLILVIDHARKLTKYSFDLLDQLRGSSSKVNAADVVALMLGDKDTRTLRFIKNRFGPPTAFQLRFEENGNGIKITGRQVDISLALSTMESCREAIEVFLRDVGGEAERAEIVSALEEMGFREGTVDKVLKKMVESGILVRPRKGLYRLPQRSLDQIEEA